MLCDACHNAAENGLSFLNEKKDGSMASYDYDYGLSYLRLSAQNNCYICMEVLESTRGLQLQNDSQWKAEWKMDRIWLGADREVVRLSVYHNNDQRSMWLREFYLIPASGKLLQPQQPLLLLIFTICE